ncbi:MAG: ribonuclease P protein component [Alphaproteobacteria bacterium]
MRLPDIEILKRRAEFRTVARGKRVTRRGFVLQAVAVKEAGQRAPRFGFTVTKKTGIAVVRNRIRRRLREAVRAAYDRAETSTDYVLIGRRAALTLSFRRLVNDLRSGLEEISDGQKAGDKAR